jgi:hypothetical protein
MKQIHDWSKAKCEPVHGLPVDEEDDFSCFCVTLSVSDDEGTILADVFADTPPEAERRASLLIAAEAMEKALEWVLHVVKHKSFCPAAENRGECDCGLRQVEQALALTKEKP